MGKEIMLVATLYNPVFMKANNPDNEAISTDYYVRFFLLLGNSLSANHSSERFCLLSFAFVTLKKCAMSIRKCRWMPINVCLFLVIFPEGSESEIENIINYLYKGIKGFVSIDLAQVY